MVFLAFIGWVGAIRKNACLLNTFVGVMIFIMLGIMVPEMTIYAYAK